MPHGRYLGFAKCPSCGRRLDLSEANEFGGLECSCGKPLVIAQRFGTAMAILCLVGSWVLPFLLGLRGRYFAYLIFAWVPAFVVLFALVSILVAPQLGLRLKIARPEPNPIGRRVLILISCWISCWFVSFGEIYILLGGASVLLGASTAERAENMEMLSTPLAWANNDFTIRPDTNILKAFGIAGFNSFFYGVLLFAAYSIVRVFQDRSLPVTLGLSGPPPGDGHDVD